MERPRFIASCSFGKDSMATVLLAKAHGEPLDEAVYCEVMFDKDISGEVPEHRDFIYETAIPALERMGVKVMVLRSPKTYVELFTGRVTRGQRKGMVRSFPLCGKCYVQRDCKVRPIERYQKALPPGTRQYVGIARDEQDRLLRLKGGSQISLLEKYKFTEKDAWQLCEKAGLLSPVYAFTDRGGCWFCPNAKRSSVTSTTTTRTCGPGCWLSSPSMERQRRSSTAPSASRTSTPSSGRRTRSRSRMPLNKRRNFMCKYEEYDSKIFHVTQIMLGCSLTDGQKKELLKISGEIDAACREGSLSEAERRQLRADMADCGLELPPDPVEPAKTPRKKTKGRER